MAGYFQPVLLAFFPPSNPNLFLSPSCLTTDFSKEPLLKNRQVLFTGFSVSLAEVVLTGQWLLQCWWWEMPEGRWLFYRCITMVLHSAWLGDCSSILTEEEESLLTRLGGFL